MRLLYGFFTLMAFGTLAARAQDTIPPDTVAAVKRATVFIRVQGADGKATGSGFVVAADKGTVLVATNYHVIAAPDSATKRLSPSELMKSISGAAVTVVFDGGTKSEASAKAEVVAADPPNDLAVLRVAGVKEPPRPIEYANPPRPVETMAVYTFGYPFGQALATGKGAPAVTVGKGSVSSLRLDDDGELALVQIDGALNPGNSGGPVVDAQGRLVGVAVASVKSAQSIGFAVPCADLVRLLKGRIGGFHLTATKPAAGKLAVRAEVAVPDPGSAIRGVTLHYLVVPPKGAAPGLAEPLEKHAAAKSLALKVSGGVATGELPLDGAEGELFVQAVPDGGPGAAGRSRVRKYSLAVPVGAAAAVLGPQGLVPPPGWREYVPVTKSYVVWLPEKATGKEKDYTTGRARFLIRHNTLSVTSGDGLDLFVHQVTYPPATMAALKKDDLVNEFRDAHLDGGKVASEGDVSLGGFPGREFRIEYDKGVKRLRVAVIGPRVFVVSASGTKEAMAKADAFLDSLRLGGQAPPARPAPAPEFRTLLPTSEKDAQTWRFTTTAPEAGWEKPDFDASKWAEAEGGFGTKGTQGAVVRTTWNTADIWMRREFELRDAPAGAVALRVHHDDDAEVYINGVLVKKAPGFTRGYVDLVLTAEGSRALKKGTNVIAVHCKQIAGAQYIDVGVLEVVEKK